MNENLKKIALTTMTEAEFASIEKHLEKPWALCPDNTHRGSRGNAARIGGVKANTNTVDVRLMGYPHSQEVLLVTLLCALVNGGGPVTQDPPDKPESGFEDDEAGQPSGA